MALRRLLVLIFESDGMCFIVESVTEAGILMKFLFLCMSKVIDGKAEKVRKV